MTKLRDTRRLVLVWTALVAATVLSWILGTSHGASTDAVQLGTTLALGVAFIKVRYVGLEFMELRAAHPALRWVFEGWIIAAGSALIVLYLTG